MEGLLKVWKKGSKEPPAPFFNLANIRGLAKIDEGRELGMLEIYSFSKDSDPLKEPLEDGFLIGQVLINFKQKSVQRLYLGFPPCSFANDFKEDITIASLKT